MAKNKRKNYCFYVNYQEFMNSEIKEIKFRRMDKADKFAKQQHRATITREYRGISKSEYSDNIISSSHTEGRYTYKDGKRSNRGQGHGFNSMDYYMWNYWFIFDNKELMSRYILADRIEKLRDKIYHSNKYNIRCPKCAQLLDISYEYKNENYIERHYYFTCEGWTVHTPELEKGCNSKYECIIDLNNDKLIIGNKLN